MAFWSNWFGTPNHAGETTNPNIPPPAPGTVGPTGYTPGDPEGVTLVGFEATESRALPKILPSAWSGWPAEWSVPNWDFGSPFNALVDIAWACLDLNSRVLSSMPVYRTRDGKIMEPATWMMNPDPLIYSSWQEFAKQLFWDYQLGEAFVLAMGRFADGFPMTFRVVPPWLVHVEIKSGTRMYRLGGSTGPDVTDDILHIRYKSTTDQARGVGPLESAGFRMVTAGVLAKYIREVATTGGIISQTLETDQELDAEDAQDLLQQWVAARAANGPNVPPILDNNVTLEDHPHMSPKDMAMLEISQDNDRRIAVLLGVHPTLVGVPTGDSMTYANATSYFDHHDRAALRPFASYVMSGMSNWALPRGQSAELNRDEYTRPAFTERATAWVALKTAGLVSLEQFQAAERLLGDAPTEEAAAATALTGGDLS